MPKPSSKSFVSIERKIHQRYMYTISVYLFFMAILARATSTIIRENKSTASSTTIIIDIGMCFDAFITAMIEFSLYPSISNVYLVILHLVSLLSLAWYFSAQFILYVC